MNSDWILNEFIRFGVENSFQVPSIASNSPEIDETRLENQQRIWLEDALHSALPIGSLSFHDSWDDFKLSNLAYLPQQSLKSDIQSNNWSIHRVRRFDVERTNQLGSTSLREILEDSRDHFRFLWAPSLPPNGWQPVTEQSGGNLPVNGSQKNRRRGKERITHEFSWPGDPLSCRFLFLVFSLRFISWRKERGNGLQNKEGEQNKTKIVLEKKTVVITRDMNKTQSDRWSVTRNHS